MAPLPDILLSLFRRSIEFASVESPQELAKRSTLSPMGVQELHRRAEVLNGPIRLGEGVKSPNTLNNQIFLGLFATVGCLMVLASIYFFFIAKNGGFVWKQNDWDDYKTTVLRRKGPNGTTLSNATKSTRLGGGSVVPKWAKSDYTASTESNIDAKEMRQMENGQAHHNKYRYSSRHDPELAAYKHEKVAKVGGINTSLAGTSQWDASNTDRSEVTAEPRSKKDKQEAAKAEKERKRREKEEQKKAAKDAAARAKDEKKARKNKAKNGDRRTDEPARPERAHRTYPSAAYSFQHGDDGTSVYTATNTAATDAYTAQPSIRAVSYYDSYRPASNLTPVREQATPATSHHSGGHRSSSRHRPSRDSMDHRSARQSPSHSRQGSPRKQHRSSRPPSDNGSYSHSHTASSDTGTKVYTHHIPGLNKGEVGFDDSVSQVAAQTHQRPRNNGGGSAPSSGGYRRGGRGYRDSELSDSEM
jgi:hypothetical protein